jgi:oxygen-dependent protoporphyrinogen oxidase
MVGGARTPNLAEQVDERLLAGVLGDLRDILGIRDEPEFVSIYRHDRAIPQYLVGHARRLDLIGEELRKFPRLVLSCNAFRGVSLFDVPSTHRKPPRPCCRLRGRRGAGRCAQPQVRIGSTW